MRAPDLVSVVRARAVAIDPDAAAAPLLDMMSQLALQGCRRHVGIGAWNS
jgi:hypothetical protein